MPISRRSFLTRSGLAAAASSLGMPALVRAQPAQDHRNGQRPRHIIHMVSDGMSSGTLTCGDYFSQTLRGRGTKWIELYSRPSTQVALMNTRSLNSIVTDSSAASSTWGSGSRVKNGAVNVLPDGRVLKPLYSLFGQAGWKRGLVTTTEITHATPAGFAANAEERSSADRIARQYLDRNIEVLMGGGKQFFDPKKRKDKFNLIEEAEDKGWKVFTKRSDLIGAPNGVKWLGLFADGHLPYTVDQISDVKLTASVPTLAEMTKAALANLQQNEHFILQIEGGRVDHGAHSSDVAATLHDQVAFDEAIETVLQFREEHPDTLVVITTDHGNSNLGLNGSGADYSGSCQAMEKLKGTKKSFGGIYDAIKKAGKVYKVSAIFGKGKPEIVEIAPKKLAQVIGDLTGFKMKDAKAEQFARFLAAKEVPMYDQLNSMSAQLGQLMANHTGLGWSGASHTADYSPLVAVGPGAERFRGFIQNVDVFKHYTELAGIDFRNPSLPLMAESGPSAMEVEEAYV